MAIATFHIHGELNFFLPRKHKNKPIEHPFDWKASIKDMVESLGVPHPEIDAMIVNGQSKNFEYIVQPGDHIEVYPDTNGLDSKSLILLRPPYPGRPRFILDTHLGRLAAYLRMMGYDTLYRNDYPDDELARVSNKETRILLTRDVGLLKRSLVIYGYYVRNTNPRKRLFEIAGRYNLAEDIQSFRHCMKCNGMLAKVDTGAIVDQLPSRTLDYFNTFHQCRSCNQIYWKGSHYEKMKVLIDEVKEQLAR